MKTLIALLVLTPLAFAQNQTATATAAGCGPAGVKFDVKADKQNHPASQPEMGKALVYFIQDDTQFETRPRPTTRIGIDGTWVGATRANSYFYVAVEPGDHHVCASWQSFLFQVGGKTTSIGGAAHTSAAAHLSAVAGHTYYFVVRNSSQVEPSKPADLKLIAADDAEGELLASQFSFSTSRPK